MEEFRDDRLGKIMSWLQAWVRGYLARKDYKKIQEQRVALQVVQRNLRKYLQLRTWPWYKLWQKVKPLLNVTRVEDEIAVSIRAHTHIQTDRPHIPPNRFAPPLFVPMKWPQIPDPIGFRTSATVVVVFMEHPNLFRDRDLALAYTCSKSHAHKFAETRRFSISISIGAAHKLEIRAHRNLFLPLPPK